MMSIALWGVATIFIICFGVVAFFGAPYVPSRRRDIETAFHELYPLGKDDVVLDVGSGDGKVLRMASQRGARAIGFELNPLLVWLARFLSRRDDKVAVRCCNFWQTEVPGDVTLVYTFLETRDIRKMERYLEKAAKGRATPLYFMSYGFALPGRAPVKKLKNMYLYEFFSRV